MKKNCINSLKVFKTQKVLSDGKIKLIDEGSSSCSERIILKIHLNRVQICFDSFFPLNLIKKHFFCNFGATKDASENNWDPIILFLNKKYI